VRSDDLRELSLFCDLQQRTTFTVRLWRVGEENQGRREIQAKKKLQKRVEVKDSQFTGSRTYPDTEIGGNSEGQTAIWRGCQGLARFDVSPLFRDSD
jgi:hypothetical protein